MKLFFLSSLFCISTFAQAEVAVIVHPSNNASMDDAAISSIFLGKVSAFPDGQKAVPVVPDINNSARAEFLEKLIGKTEAQYKSYWAHLVFTGQSQPPREMPDDAKTLELIATNPNMIGIIDASHLNDTVKRVK
ncbi:MAG: phosphate ABC transporter substrate-binding protein [Oceanospirillaceae bacterium]|nr:phosphate ABC transporter substrate-binding protein [Oceanospirillaceae bacterium]